MSDDHDDLPVLRAYLGDVQFSNALKAYFGEVPHSIANPPWHIFHLPKFLKAYPAFHYRPEIVELAILELAFQKAFVAPALVKKIGHPTLHPSVSKLVFEQNTTSIWSALICNMVPPKPHKLENPQSVLVWRQANSARFRLLGQDEEKQLTMLDREDFGVEHYLNGWIESELVLPAVTRADILMK